MTVSIPPFANVPAPNDPVRSDWAQQLTQYAVDHVNDGGDAHDATAISFAPTGTIAATNVQGAVSEVATDAAANLAAQAASLTAHLDDATDAHDASAISFVPSGTIASTNVQAAILEVAAEAGTGGGGSAAVDAHIANPLDAHDATAISFTPVGTIAATTVQGAIAELAAEGGGGGGGGITDHGELSGLTDDDHPQYAKAADFTAHLADTADAHDASAISFVPTGTIAATNVQSALAEVAAEVGGAGVTDGDKGEITVSGSGTVWVIDSNAVVTAKIADAAVTNAKLANVATDTIKGRVASGTGAPTDLTPAQVRSVIAADAGGSTSNFLRADGTWAVPSTGPILLSDVSMIDVVSQYEYDTGPKLNTTLYLIVS